MIKPLESHSGWFILYQRVENAPQKEEIKNTLQQYIRLLFVEQRLNFQIILQFYAPVNNYLRYHLEPADFNLTFICNSRDEEILKG